MDPSSSQQSGSEDSPVIVLRVVIRSPDVATFVAKYSRFLKDDRIFIFTKASQPPGTRVRFALELAEGPLLMSGEGTVTRVRADSGDPSKPPGMELRFAPLDDPSREMVKRMLAEREVAPSLTVAAIPEPPKPPPVPPPALPPLQPPMARMPASIDDVSTKIRMPGGATATNPGTSPGTNPGTSPPALPPVPVPVGDPPTPPAGVALASTVPALRAQQHPGGRDSDERTDVDARERRRFHSQPPSFMTSPTPLPAPLPLPAMMTPPHGTPLGEESRPSLPPLSVTGAAPIIRDSVADRETRAERVLPGDSDGHDVGPTLLNGERPPRMAESWAGPLPPPPGAPPPPGQVPANPFSDVSDGAIEYFVEWSLEQSQASGAGKNKPKPQSSYADVPMFPPKADRAAAGGRVRFIGGMLVGLAMGVPAGALGWWFYQPQIAAPGSGAPALRSEAPKQAATVAPVQKPTPVAEAPAAEKAAAEAPVEKPVEDKAAIEKAAKEKAAADRASEKAAKEWAAKEKVAADKAAKEQAVADRASEKAAKEQAAKEKAASERAAKEQAVKERAVQKAAAKEKAANEKAANERAAGEKAANEKAVKEKAANEKAANEKAANEKAANEKAAGEKAAGEKAANEKAANEKAVKEKAAKEKAANEKAASEKAVNEKAVSEKLGGEKAAGEKAAGEKAANEKAANEKAANEKAANEKAAGEKKTGADKAAVERAAAEKAVAERPAAPPATEAPGELPPPPSLNTKRSMKSATLRVRSSPPGGEVSVKGETRGPAPVEVELAPNHRYDVQVLWPGGKIWKKRINLKPPLTEVTAK